VGLGSGREIRSRSSRKVDTKAKSRRAKLKQIGDDIVKSARPTSTSQSPQNDSNSDRLVD